MGKEGVRSKKKEWKREWAEKIEMLISSVVRSKSNRRQERGNRKV